VSGRVISAIGKVENLWEGLRENKVNIRANGMSMAVCHAVVNVSVHAVMVVSVRAKTRERALKSRWFQTNISNISFS